MITTMDEDYALLAQAKGLPKHRVIWYAARNAILPSISGFSLAIGFVVSGALLTEIVFSYPGLGFILLNAVQEGDYALLQGIFLVITMAVLVANLAADFVYVFLDRAPGGRPEPWPSAPALAWAAAPPTPACSRYRTPRCAAGGCPGRRRSSPAWARWPCS